MPYSDNLYSADDESETESFSDELSPTDGYFNRRDMPTDYLVPDPSQASNPSDDKDEIARQEARQNSQLMSRAAGSPFATQMPPSQRDASAATSYNVPPSPVSNSRSSPISPRQSVDLYTESAPLTPAPPPAYSASLTSPITPTFLGNRNYSTFSPHLLEHGFAPREEPESMGGRLDVPSETTPLAISTADRSSLPHFSTKRSSPCRILIRKLLFLALVIAVMTGLLTTSLNWESDKSLKHSPPGGSGGPYCSSATIKHPQETITYGLGTGRALNVFQTTHQGDNSISAKHVTTSGEIRLRQLPKDSKNGAHFTLDVRVSHPDLAIIKNWDTNTRTLKVSTPQHADLNSSGPHCISLEVTAWLSEDANLSTLKLRSVTLGQRVFDDLNISVSKHAEFVSVTGDIAFPKFTYSEKGAIKAPSFSIPGFSLDSRRIEVRTVSGSIRGLYPLYDFLGLYSKSGTISVGVDPHAIEPIASSPATLEVTTTSSTITVQLPLENTTSSPPSRNYVTHVESTSGSIHGSYYLGSSTTFKSRSGSFTLDVLPVIQIHGTTVYQGNFVTQTISGSTNIKLLEPIFAAILSSKQPKSPYQPIGNDDPYLLLPPNIDHVENEIKSRDTKEGKLRNLLSSHSTTSGNINLQYPLAWEGTISAKSRSGSLLVSGEGVSLIRETQGWGYKELVAKKGVDYEGEGSSIEVHSVSGSLHFNI